MCVEAGQPLHHMLNMAGSPPLIIQEHYCDADQFCARNRKTFKTTFKTVEVGSPLQQMLNMAGSPS